MRVILVLSAAVAAVLAAPPAVAPQRPSGRLILLPARQQYPPPAQGATTTSTTPAPRRDQDNAPTEKPSDDQSEKLLDAGEYYVLTPEGKLQMVKYTTAPLKNPSAQPAQLAQAPKPEPFAQFQIEYFQYPTFEVQPSAQVKAEESKESEEEESEGFEAKLQFRDVKPIPAPIYTYNPVPAVRILKK